MIGLGKKFYYCRDGSLDWLRTIVRTVTFFSKNDAILVVSIAAKRAQKLYYKKTDIRSLLKEEYHG